MRPIQRPEPALERRIIGVMRLRHYSRQTELGDKRSVPAIPLGSEIASSDLAT